jgi:hypothetical protein
VCDCDFEIGHALLPPTDHASSRATNYVLRPGWSLWPLDGCRCGFGGDKMRE